MQVSGRQRGQMDSMLPSLMVREGGGKITGI